MTDQNYQSGVYAGVHFSEESKDEIMEMIKEMGLPNAVKRDSLHCTVLYSETPLDHFDVVADTTEINPSFKASISHFEAFDTDDGTCLVAVISSPRLFILHHTLKSASGAEHSYPTYTPHITLSYDCPDAKSYLNKTPSVRSVEVIELYAQPRVDDWADSNA